MSQLSQDSFVNALFESATENPDLAHTLDGLGSQDLPDFSSQDLAVLDAYGQIPDDGLLADGPAAPAAFGLTNGEIVAEPDHLVMSQPDSHDQLMDWGDVRLQIVDHRVHKIVAEGTPNKEYVVSNLKPFVVKVKLYRLNGPDGVQVRANTLDVRATLLYENGNVVRASADNEQLLEGDTEVTIIGGQATLKLKMGVNMLSSKMGRQRFRVRIEPRDETLRNNYQMLSATGAELRSVTKLERKPANMRGEAPPPTPPVPAAPGATPSHVATATASPLPSLASPGAAALGGGGPVFTPSSAAPAAPAGPTGPSPMSDLPNAAELKRLRDELVTERSAREQLQQHIDAQKREMAELAAQNKDMLEKMAALKEMQESQRGVEVARHPSNGVDRPAASRRKR